MPRRPKPKPRLTPAPATIEQDKACVISPGLFKDTTKKKEPYAVETVEPKARAKQE